MISLTARNRKFVEIMLPFLLFASLIAVFDLRYHEFWRDEVNALLEARTVPWRNLLEAMRIEGVPPFFHVLLKICGSFLPNPQALVTVGAIGFTTLLWGTYQLLFSISNQRRESFVLTICLATSYGYAYEFGVIVRQYALGLGFAFGAWAYLRRALQSGRLKDVYIGTLAAGLSALSSAHSACVAGGVLLSFGCLAIASRRPWAWWRVILLTLPCFALDAYLAAPYSERTAEGNVIQPVRIGSVLPLAAQGIIEGIIPGDFWHVDAFVPPNLHWLFAVFRSLTFWGVLAATIIIVFIRRTNRHLSRRGSRFDLVALFSGWIPLLFIIVYHYWGSYRHHVFLGMPAFVLLVGHLLDARISGVVARPMQRFALVLLVPWFLLNGAISIASFVADVRYPFADSKEASKLLSRNARIVADADWIGVGLAFWRPDVHLRATNGEGRSYRYIRADKRWHARAPLVPLIIEECVVDPARVYYVGAEKSLGPFLSCANQKPCAKSPFEAQPLTGEGFDVFSIDCECVTRKNRPSLRNPLKR